MTTTFTWAINNLEHYVTDGIVYLVYYSVVADDGTYVNSICNSIRLAHPEGDIIPYTDLTSELVIGWTKDKLNVPAIEAALQAQLDEQAAPTKAAGLPWAVLQAQLDEQAAPTNAAGVPWDNAAS